MTNDTDTFVQEVDESLRQDRMLAFAKKYGPWLIGAFVVVLIGVAAWLLWKDYSLNRSRAHADEYLAAQRLAAEGNLQQASAEFERLSGEGPRIYRIMARLEHAALLETAGDLQAALSEFDRAAEQASDPIMRDTARLRAAYIVADTQDFDALQTRLQPLLGSDSRLGYLARELLAIEAWEAGNIELARETLQNLTLAFDAPEAVQQRAQIALSVIGPAPATSADGASAPAPSEGETK